MLTDPVFIIIFGVTMIKKQFSNIFLMTAMFSCMGAYGANAADAVADPSEESATSAKTGVHGFVGLGAMAMPQYEGSDDYEASVWLPFKVNYQTYYLESSGSGLRANLSPVRSIEFGPSLTGRYKRDDSVDNNQVKKLKEVDTAVEAGGFVSVPFYNAFQKDDKLSLEVQAVSDVSGTHDGTLVSFGPRYAFNATPDLFLRASLTGLYVSDNYNERYFGITSDDSARSGLSQYSASGGFESVGVGLNSRYALNDSWGVIGLVNYRQLLGDAADSPIVKDAGSKGQVVVGAGVAYSF